MADLFTLVGRISIEADNALSVIDQVTQEAQGLYGYLSGTNASGSNATRNATSYWGNMWTNIGRATTRGINALDVAAGNLLASTVTKVTNAGKSFLQTGYEFNRNMEVWTASFKTYLNGDANAAMALMQEVRQFAIDTPLSVSDSVQAAVKLMASGIESGDVINKLKMLGDIANGNTEKMGRLGTVVAQVISATKLAGNDPYQFKEAGVPIYDLLLEYYHANGYNYIDEAFLQEMQRKGGISSDDVLGALEMATSPGGMYFNAMNNQMDTAMGKAQKMKDNYEQTAGAFTKAIFDVFNADTINALNSSLDKLFNWANTNPEGLQKLASSFSALATTGIDALVTSLTKLIDFYGDHSQELNLLLSLVGTLLLFNGHPALGLGMIGMAQGGTIANAQAEWEKDISGEGETNLSDTLLSSESKAILASGGSKADLSESQQKAYGFGEAVYGTLDRVEGALKLVLGESYELKSADGLASYILDKTFASFWMMDDYLESGAAALSTALENPDTKINTNHIWDVFKEAFGSDDDVPEVKRSPALEMFHRDKEKFEGIGGNTGGLNGLIAALNTTNATLSTLNSDVASAVQEGVGNITVTGSITTGDVMFDTGVVAAQLAPQLDLKLGAANARAGRGSA